MSRHTYSDTCTSSLADDPACLHDVKDGRENEVLQMTTYASSVCIGNTENPGLLNGFPEAAA
jgi:hypothetical protein